MIHVEHLTVRYGGLIAIDDINLEIADGEFVLITGASGCGKSTLARCLNGIIPHSTPAEVRGSVLINSHLVDTSSVAEMATEIGMVFQNPATQLFNLIVEDEVAFGPRNLGLESAEVARNVRAALDAVGIAHLWGRHVQTLSGGEQQRLAIASALAMGSRVLVLDEPTASLDVTGTRAVLTTLARLNAAGVTILVIEHRLEAAHVARRTIVMEHGCIACDGATDEVFQQRELLRRLGLRRPADLAKEDWARLLEPKGKHEGVPLVELKGVEAGYGSQMVLRGLNLTLYQGEFAALVGENAAGKSTLAHVLAGLVKPRRGAVYLGNGPALTPGRDVGLLFQNPLHQLFCDTVEQEVRFGLQTFDCDRPSAVDGALAATDLAGVRTRPIMGLSSGQQQRTALAAILALQPRLIILDEPTLGQDWRHLSRFMDFLVELNRAGATILLITHDYKLVHHYAHRILVLKDGRIAADGAPREIHSMHAEDQNAL